METQAGPLTVTTVADATGARQFASLLAELCLRALAISLVIAGVIFAYLAVSGGSLWVSTP